MSTSNKEKYIKYKTKQNLLNRRRINLVLDQDIAKTIKQYIKKHNRAIFEYQLKCHFLKEPLINIADTNYQAGQTIPNINLLIDELQKEIDEIHKTMQVVQKTIETIISKWNYPENNKDNTQSIQLKLVSNSTRILSKSQNKHKRRKIPNEILDLAISLYQNLKSWKKVCNELAEQGYLSLNNTPYTTSSLLRAISKYKSRVKEKINS